MTIQTVLLIITGLLFVFPVAAVFNLHRRVVRIEYVDNLHARGNSTALKIRVRRGTPYEQSTVEHEYEHVRQKWLGAIIVHALLSTIPRYRLQCEIWAYRVSVDHGRPVEDAAIALSNGQNISFDRALKYLED